MQRLRRHRQRQEFVPVAAEVLEYRALLSSAAAAVQGATHHAAIQQADTPAVHVAPQAGFHTTLSMLVTISGSPNIVLPGKFSLGKFNVAVGSHVSASFSSSLSANGTKVSVKASFAGNIFDFGPLGGGITAVVIVPTGGSITFTVKEPHRPAVKATAIPNGTTITMLLTTATNAFAGIGETDVFKPGSPGGQSGHTITITAI